MESIFAKFQPTAVSGPPAEFVVPWFSEDDSTPSYSDVDTDTCPHCQMQDCFDQSELVTCRNCGHVVRRPFDTTAEYRFFSNDDRGGDPTRVGAPQDPTLPLASLGTVILGGSYGGKTRTMFKVRKHHSWNTVPYKERSLMQAHERLSLVGLNHGINQSAVESSRSMYCTLKEIGGRQGLSRDAMLAGCMYLVLKQSGSPRKPKDVSDIFGLSSATFTKALKQLQELLAMARQKGLLTQTKAKTSVTSTKAIEYIAVPLSRLPLERVQLEHLMVLCRRVAEQVEELGIGQENMPPSLAAGCVAFVLKRCEGLDISLAQIATVSEISLATLQKCLRRLEQHLDPPNNLTPL